MTVPGDVAAEIVRLHTVEGWRVGTIARHLGVHHTTVERVLSRAGATVARAPRRSMIDPYVPFIEETLERYPSLPASVLYRMVRKRGYPGGEDHFRHRVARLRPRKQAEAYLVLRTLPGEQAQMDWAYFGKHPVEGGERRLSAFVMVLSYSRMLFVRFFFDERMGSFQEGHVRAFSFFGGVTRAVLYDNLKSAVLELHGHARRFHPALLELASHYHYRPVPVAVRRGNEKGRVERAVRYLRTSFWPAISFAGLDDLNRQAEAFCTEVAPRRRWPEQRQLLVADAFAKERSSLEALPGDPFPAVTVVETKVRKTPYVWFDANRYSVPSDRVQRPVTVRADSELVRVFDGVELIAEHPRSWDKQRIIEDAEHVRELERSKRAARRHRTQDRVLRAVPRAEELLTEMAKRGRWLGVAVARLGMLLDRFGRAELARAVEEALANDAPSVEAVQLILDQRRRAANEPPVTAVELPDRPEIRDIEVIPHDLSEYDPEDPDHD
ncbi:MAG TPA: IS21 family transposase [Acidobacteria bacterium]|nr:IS21 family transposase [Acidobacteriota bacterium]